MRVKEFLNFHFVPGAIIRKEITKTWGNILGTHRGLKNIIERYNFKIKKIIDSRNWPLYIAQR